MPILKKFSCWGLGLGRANMYISILVWLGTCISTKDIIMFVFFMLQIAMCSAHAYLSKKGNRTFCVPYMLWFTVYCAAVVVYVQCRFQTIVITVVAAAVIEPFAIFKAILIYNFYEEGHTAGNPRSNV